MAFLELKPGKNGARGAGILKIRHLGLKRRLFDLSRSKTASFWCITTLFFKLKIQLKMMSFWMDKLK